MAPDRHEPATEVEDEMDTVARLIRTAGRRTDPTEIKCSWPRGYRLIR